MARSVQKILLVDASKFGQVRPAFFAKLDEFDQIITDDALPQQAAGDESLISRLRIAAGT